MWMMMCWDLLLCLFLTGLQFSFHHSCFTRNLTASSFLGFQIASLFVWIRLSLFWSSLNSSCCITQCKKWVINFEWHCENVQYRRCYFLRELFNLFQSSSTHAANLAELTLRVCLIRITALVHERVWTLL